MATAAALAVVAGVFVHPTVATAADSCSIKWAGGSGAWTDPARWAAHRVPTRHDSVCIVRAPGAAEVSVQVSVSTGVGGLTVRGATLSVSPTAAIDVTQVVADDAVLTGGGTLRGTIGTITVRDSRLAGIHVVSTSRLSFAGQVLVTGGSTVDSTSQVDLPDGVRIVDGDGNAANHIGLARFPLYLTGSVFVGVPLGLTDVALFAQGGNVVLASLDNLDADGTLHATYARSTLQLGTSSDGTITLPRSITAVGRRVTVFAGGITTPDGGNALRTVGSITGYLSLGQQLVTAGPVTVYGTLNANAPLVAPVVSVRPGAQFSGTRVTGTLNCAGGCAIGGAHLGRLSLSPSAAVGAVLTEPIVVDGVAKLDGLLDVYVPSQIRSGASLVMVTAAGGVTGTFARIDTGRPHRIVTPGYQPTFVTGTVVTTA